jgi:ATP-dependent DNA helicase RecG
VGGATLEALARLLPASNQVDDRGVILIRDLLFHLPVGLVDRRFTCPLRAAPDGVIATFTVTVTAHQPPPPGRYNTKKPYKVMCENDTGDITLVFFNMQTDYIKRALPEGKIRLISGRVEHFDHHLQMPHPDIITTPDKREEIDRVEPVYPLTVGLTSRRIAKIVEDATASIPVLPEWIDFAHMPANYQALPDWKTALQQAHHPQNLEDLEPASPARLRLAYDEMLANQLHLGLRRLRSQNKPGEVITGDGSLTEALIQSLPYRLTEGQRKVGDDIARDMASGRRMGRLLQGDVGSGKTIVALMAMLKAVEQGMQAALMVPTELIASQHYEVISKLLGFFGDVEVVLLTGSVKGAARAEILQEIKNGEANIIIGTHALFQDHVEFHKLALVVVDEQHRFGVNQRLALTNKGDSPHILHMTATPIPRSLTLTLYGDMDCSLLTEKPAERIPIKTRVIPLSRYEEVLERLRAALERGEKAYWICPLIEDSDTDLAAATSRHHHHRCRCRRRCRKQPLV